MTKIYNKVNSVEGEREKFICRNKTQ